MSDPSSGPNGATQGGLATSPIAINAQYVKDLSFENPNSPQILAQLREQPAVQVNVDVKARKLADTVFEVVLVVRAEARHGETVAFMAEITYGGVFTVSGVGDDQLQPLLLIECPRLLFPYARAILSETVRDGGFPPLLLQPLDFAEMYRRTPPQQMQA
jgi:preprotein translocase subunit SecB